MSEFMIQETTLTELADAIRERNNTAETIPVADMARQIREGAENCKNHIDTATIYDWSRYCYNGARFETLPYIDTSNGHRFDYICYGVTDSFEAEFNCPKAYSMTYAFYQATGLKKLVLHFSETNSKMFSSGFQNAFRQATEVTEIIITGKIYVTSNDLNFAYCAKLSAESIVSILNALIGDPNVSHEIQLGNALIKKLTDEQKQIATDKNLVLV